jgi:diguanylate cyclase (GGDEF)-like protein
VPPYGLIAELDTARAQLYRQIVAAVGLEPVVTRDGEEARAAVRSRGAPGLVVTELSLPRVDGFGLIGEVRKLASSDKAPVVAISAFADLREVATRLAGPLGIAAVLPTTATPAAMQRAVKRALDGDPAEIEGPAPRQATRPGRDLGAFGLSEDEELDEPLQNLAAETANKFGVPVSLVSLMFDQRQLFKGRVGLDDGQVASRDWPFCKQVVSGREPLVVPDAEVHPLFQVNPAVRAGVRGYAGAPLTTPQGDVLGALCIASYQPLSIGAHEVDELVVRARRVVGELELRAAARKVSAALLPRARVSGQLAVPVFGDASTYLAAVLANIEAGILLMAPDRTIVYANAAIADMIGIPTDTIVGKRRDELLEIQARLYDDPSEFLRKVQIDSDGASAAREEFEQQRPRRRVLRWVAKPIRLEGGIGQLDVYTDITAEVDLARERESLARTDWLTGLANRRGGEESIAREVARARRTQNLLSFALFDIDYFKKINDKYGHAAGDEVLRRVGKVLQQEIRATDLAVRWGGEELMVVLPTVGEDGARIFAERVRSKIEALDMEADELPRITVSGGIAELRKFEDVTETLERADAKLYEAKAEGRNRIKG